MMMMIDDEEDEYDDEYGDDDEDEYGDNDEDEVRKLSVEETVEEPSRSDTFPSFLKFPLRTEVFPSQTRPMSQILDDSGKSTPSDWSRPCVGVAGASSGPL
ncbi:hypothetical protein INR49_018019, partial [Caranx melampygus]